MNPLDDIKKEVEDRASNPVLGTFLVSWVLIHWKIFIAVIYGPPENIDRIKFVSDQLHNAENAFSLLGLPFIITILLISFRFFFGQFYFLADRHFRFIREKRLFEDQLDLKELGEFRVLLRSAASSLNGTIRQMHDSATKSLQDIAKMDRVFGDPNALKRQVSAAQVNLENIVNIHKNWEDTFIRKIGIGSDLQNLDLSFSNFAKNSKILTGRRSLPLEIKELFFPKKNPSV